MLKKSHLLYIKKKNIPSFYRKFLDLRRYYKLIYSLGWHAASLVRKIKNVIEITIYMEKCKPIHDGCHIWHPSWRYKSS